MKLTILGTGNAFATKVYNTCFCLEDEGNAFLVDAGGGNTILSQLEKAGIDFHNIHDIFVTHKHVDHILGIIWIIRIICQNMGKDKFKGEVNLYAHGEVIEILRDMAEKLLQPKQVKFLDDRFHLIEVKDGDRKEILGREVTFFDIYSTKAKQFGFKMGDLCCLGDEPYNAKCEKYARGAKYLMHEAFCLYSMKDIYQPYEKHHSTALDAGKLASELEVENLILYHTEDDHLDERKEMYTLEAKENFKGNVLVPEDLETFEI
ncbi:MAG: MBL fold metallo-hydrolase [Clostridia bacterium]|nr:MBL fold metallo-hydrolase [Clostridia bacterium]